MAVALGTWSHQELDGDVSYSHTVPAGSNRLGFGFIAFFYSTLPTGLTATLGGNSMTAITASPAVTSVGGSKIATYAFYILESSMPASGAQTITYTITGGTGRIGEVLATVVLTDANQAEPSSAKNSTNGATSLVIPSAGTLTVKNGGAGISYIGTSANPTFTESASWTERVDAASEGVDTRHGAADRTYSGDGTDSITWTLSSSQQGAGWLFAVDPVGGGGGGTQWGAQMNQTWNRIVQV